MPLGYYGMSGSYILYFLLIMLIPLWAQFKVKRTYERYKKVRTKSGLTGKEVAENYYASKWYNRRTSSKR